MGHPEHSEEIRDLRKEVYGASVPRLLVKENRRGKRSGRSGNGGGGW